MVYVAEQLLTTARAVALDPAAQTPYMEKAQEVGLSVNGGMHLSDPVLLLT